MKNRAPDTRKSAVQAVSAVARPGRRRNACVLWGTVATFGLCLGAAAHAGDADVPETDPQSRAAYSAGYAFGERLADLRRAEPGFELEAVFQGILDALTGAAPRLTPEEMKATLDEIERTRAAGSSGDDAAPQEVPRLRGGGFVDDFAALNAKREGVVTLPSGVQYEILQAGSGRRPGADDVVLVSYEASLSNGSVFDSTRDSEQPARLSLNEIAVPGLKEALLLMNEGARWRVVIPPGQGFRTSGNNMLRRRDLIYDIELVSIAAAEPETPEAAAAAPSATTPEPR